MDSFEAGKHFSECEKESSHLRESIIQRAEQRCTTRMHNALQVYEQHLLKLKRQLMRQWEAEEENSRNLLSKNLQEIIETYKREIELTL